MEIIKIDPNKVDPQAIDRIHQVLLKGGIIAYPTDTVYGLGAMISDRVAVGKIKRLKQRSADKPISIMVKDTEMAEEYAYVPPGIEKYLPGRYTILLRKKDGIKNWISNNEMVGVRIPDYSFTRVLMKHMIEPITTTSANFSGRPPVHSIKSLFKQFGEQAKVIDLIVDAGQLAYHPPSAVINLTE